MFTQAERVMEANPLMSPSQLLHSSKHLVRTTRPLRVKDWNRLTSKLLFLEVRRVEDAKNSEPEKGEVRLEISWARLNKQGLQKLGMISPTAGAGDGMVLVKSVIPGDNPPEQLSEPYPLAKGYVKFKGRNHELIQRQYQTEHNPEERAELNEILEDVDPSRSEVTIELSLATKNGREMRGKDEKGNDVVKGLIGRCAISLKELLRVGVVNEATGTCQDRKEFELLGVVDIPEKKGPGAVPPPKVEKKPPPLKRSNSSGRTSGRISNKVEPVAEEPDDDSDDEEGEEKPVMLVPVGVIFARIAIKPPDPPPKLPAGVKPPPGAGGDGGGGMQMSGLADKLMMSSGPEPAEDDFEMTPLSEPMPIPLGEMPTVSPDFGAGVLGGGPFRAPLGGDPLGGGPLGGGPLGGGPLGSLPPLAPIPTAGGAWPAADGEPSPALGDFPGMAGSASFQNLGGGMVPPPPAYPPPGMQQLGMAPQAPGSLMGLATPAVRAAPSLPDGVPPPSEAPPSPPGSSASISAALGVAPKQKARWRRWGGPTQTPPPSPPAEDALTLEASPIQAAAEVTPSVPQSVRTRSPPPEPRAPASALPSRPAASPVPLEPGVSATGSVAGDRRRRGDDDDARSVKSDKRSAKDGDSEGSDDEGGGGKSSNIKANNPAGAALGFLAQTLAYTATMDTLCYTIAYWIKFKPMETLSDQMFFFGETRNMPALIRGNKLGALVDNKFCATDFDPRLTGDNWCLLIITNDGTYSRFWIGYNSNDAKGVPQPARAQEPDSSRPATYVRTEMANNVKIRRLVTTTKGAGLLAQAWIWPRDLEEEEIYELWVETKNRYPLWKPGITSYRPPPSTSKGKASASRGVTPKARKGSAASAFALATDDKAATPTVPELPWDKYDPIIEKDNAAMLDIPLASKLAFQRLKNVFAVLVDYATYSDSFLVIDRLHNASPTAELMIEVALRANTGKNPLVMVMDSRPRLEKADAMLKALIDCKFLIDEEKAYKKVDAMEKPKLTDYKLTSTDYATPMADLRRLVTPAGLAWMRASAAHLEAVEQIIDSHPKHPNMCKAVRSIYREFGCEQDLMPDKRPIIGRIWKVYYEAQLFASGTHYIIFDSVELKAKPVISTLGTIGSIFINGSTDEHKKVVQCIQDGSPILLLESTGGVAQAFSYVVKAVRLMKPSWHIDSVLRLVTEYKQRAAKTHSQQRENLSRDQKQLVVKGIENLDKELARIDLLLSAGEYQESWMRNFGLPEMLMLFEIWQRSSEFLVKSIKTADVMKHDAEMLLDLFTNCFSSASAPPELGLGNAQKKVVQTAWNRHLILYNNAAMYNKRSWTLQFILYFLAVLTTLLSILTSNYTPLAGDYFLDLGMLLLPIVTALIGTVSTRLRQQQKFSACKMASYEIVSEIYKFRTGTMDYEGQALAAALKAAKEGPADKKKKGDEEPVAPISAKEKDKEARKKFVENTQKIYTACMQSEMSKGTSASHKTGGLDPARLLLDEANAEDAEATTRALQRHVAGGLYFIDMREWALTCEFEKQRKKAEAEKQQQAFQRAIKGAVLSVVQGILMLIINLFAMVILGGYAIYEQVTHRVKTKREDIGAGGRALQKAAGIKVEEDPEATKKIPEPSNAQATQEVMNRAQRFVNKMKNAVRFAAVNADAVGNYGIGGGDKSGAAAAVPAVGEVDVDVERAEKLNAPLYEEKPGMGGGGDDAGGDDEGDGGAIFRKLDNLMTEMSIDDYMKYRARPICSYFERTAPWRAFELQCLEVIIFTINASGAVLVGLGPAFVPYVALTVGVGAVCKSFVEFSRLEKQVEAFNQAQRDIHNLINKWDGLTRTERRTIKCMQEVVGTVENAMLAVAIALTDANPLSQGGADGGGDGEEGEKKEE